MSQKKRKALVRRKGKTVEIDYVVYLYNLRKKRERRKAKDGKDRRPS